MVLNIALTIIDKYVRTGFYHYIAFIMGVCYNNFSGEGNYSQLNP